MKIENGVLVGDERMQVDVSKIQPAGRVIVPECIVIHYAVTDSIDATVAAQLHQGFHAHLSIDGHAKALVEEENDKKKGKKKEPEKPEFQITQLVNFACRGSHAGKSTWNGKPGVNAFSIGIEISNPGPLVEKDGELKTTWGKAWPREEAFAGRHSFKYAPKQWAHWAVYTQQEIEMVIEISRLLTEEYPSIIAIVGHDEISPGRKFDPGPAFPMEKVRKAVFG